jgi:hypothetical protein
MFLAWNSLKFVQRIQFYATFWLPWQQKVIFLKSLVKIERAYA